MRNAFSIALILFVASSAMSAPLRATYTFPSQRRPGQTDHVVVDVKVEGETKFVDGGKSQSEKMSVVCNVEYDEKTLETPATANGRWRSVRHYTTATAVVKVGDDGFKPTLRSDRRLICAEATGQTTLLFSPLGPLSRAELDLIDVQANSLLWDQLLPERAVAVDDTWKQSERFWAAMLGLDEVAKTDVRSRLKEVTDMVARFEISGGLEGAIHGVPTRIELKGKYRFDRRSRRIDWFAMLIKEDRQSSLVADGIEANSVFQMTARPVDDVADLSNKALKNVALKSSPDLAQLTCDLAGQWQFHHDRRWYMFKDHPTSAVLRIVERGEVLGQCNVSPLPDRAPDKLVSLEEFQADIRQALGKGFGEFVEASQKIDDAQHRVLRVVADGEDSDIPIRWVYYHVADRKGRQAALTFTVEKGLLERFADADRPLVQSLRCTDPATNVAKTHANSAKKR